jgi:acyl carrier protein phosphodiesterase
MNFLAHCFLSCGHEERLVGNFLTDYIGNMPITGYPQGIQDGILLHRKIDTFTDSHPEVLKGTRRLYPYHHKYAPVVIDIFYDYLLSQNWTQYSNIPLEDFTQATYRTLEKYRHLMPERLQKRLPLMIKDDWLYGYSTEYGIKYTFSRLQKRVSRPSHLDGAWQSLHRDYAALDEEFNVFFPDIVRFVQEVCFC